MKSNLLLLISSVILFGCSQNEKTSEKRPNIVFILADDLGAYDLSYMDDSYYESPNIDRLAESSIQFSSGYASARVCSPSRASILTGKTPLAHGITDYIGASTGERWGKKRPFTRLIPPKYHRQLDSSDITMAEHLQSNGYKTFFAGKWHLGSKGSWPKDHGFDINKGGWEHGLPKGGYFSPYSNDNLEDGPTGENLSERLAMETAKFIEENKDESFFAYLSFYAVHGPIQTNQTYWEKYREKAVANGIDSSGFKMEKRLPIRTSQDNPIYAGLVNHMDDAVGIVIRKLEELNLDENTIIVFTSDNGGVASGDAFSTSNAPLRGGKGYQWEGGIRVPYLIKVPGSSPKVVEYPASGQDFYPTLVELAGLPMPAEQEVSGISLKNAIEGNQTTERMLYWHYPHYGNQGGDPASIVRKGNYKLIYLWETQTAELYNLENDLSETSDISGKNEALVADMKKSLFEELESNKVKYLYPNPYFTEQLLLDQMQDVTENLLPRLEYRRLNMLKENYKPNNDWWGSTKD